MVLKDEKEYSETLSIVKISPHLFSTNLTEENTFLPSDLLRVWVH